VNFRHAAGDLLPEKVTLAVVDRILHLPGGTSSRCSPASSPPGPRRSPLVKPQFEVGRGRVGKGGVVRDDAAAPEAVDGSRRSPAKPGTKLLGEADSRVPGPKGNREVFLHLRWPAAGAKGPLDFGGGGR